MKVLCQDGSWVIYNNDVMEKENCWKKEIKDVTCMTLFGNTYVIAGTLEGTLLVLDIISGEQVNFIQMRIYKMSYESPPISCVATSSRSIFVCGGDRWSWVQPDKLFHVAFYREHQLWNPATCVAFKNHYSAFGTSKGHVLVATFEEHVYAHVTGTNTSIRCLLALTNWIVGMDQYTNLFFIQVSTKKVYVRSAPRYFIPSEANIYDNPNQTHVDVYIDDHKTSYWINRTMISQICACSGPFSFLFITKYLIPKL